MSNEAELKSVVDAWLNDTQNIIIKNYKDKKIKASGKFEREINNKSH